MPRRGRLALCGIKVKVRSFSFGQSLSFSLDPVFHLFMFPFALAVSVPTKTQFVCLKLCLYLCLCVCLCLSLFLKQVSVQIRTRRRTSPGVLPADSFCTRFLTARDVLPYLTTPWWVRVLRCQEVRCGCDETTIGFIQTASVLRICTMLVMQPESVVPILS